jgi:hypothetical protein
VSIREFVKKVSNRLIFSTKGYRFLSLTILDPGNMFRLKNISPFINWFYFGRSVRMRNKTTLVWLTLMI